MRETIQRKNQDSWERFFKSGRVEDYLSYVSGTGKSENEDTVTSHWEGDGSHAGFYTGDRHHIEADTYR